MLDPLESNFVTVPPLQLREDGSQIPVDVTGKLPLPLSQPATYAEPLASTVTADR